ncbi:hypothetical protein COO60DRAFT_908683 [Scenedesmus sp. NREL 46B-D3]|nr:hypothetical protein COO60DRAFT_908683 [Scenedesmus sp. NREL 46B-D3]
MGSAIIIIIIILPIQAIASAPSAPRPTGAEREGSTAPECLHALRTPQDLTRKAAIHRHHGESQRTSHTAKNTQQVRGCTCSNLIPLVWRRRALEVSDGQWLSKLWCSLIRPNMLESHAPFLYLRGC